MAQDWPSLIDGIERQLALSRVLLQEIRGPRDSTAHRCAAARQAVLDAQRALQEYSPRRLPARGAEPHAGE